MFKGMEVNPKFLQFVLFM